jgi:hypothetical protein
VTDDDERPGKPEKKDDVLFVHTPLPGGDGYRVLRKRDETLQLGEIRTMKEGRPIHGEVVKLKPREGEERLFDVEVLAEAPSPPADGRKGPAQVATNAYRTNWESIFARLPEGGEAPN